jgi:hypothetical protein
MIPVPLPIHVTGESPHPYPAPVSVRIDASAHQKPAGGSEVRAETRACLEARKATRAALGEIVKAVSELCQTSTNAFATRRRVPEQGQRRGDIPIVR